MKAEKDVLKIKNFLKGNGELNQLPIIYIAMNDDEAIEMIKRNISAELREQITTQLVRCEVGGLDWTKGRKAGLLRKTRSKKFPFVATHYGNLIMKTTEMGQTYFSIGKR